MSKTLRYGAYHRVSQANGRKLDDDSTMTDKVAFERIDGWAKLSGVTIVERYLDWDRTGSKFNRPELNRMLDDLRAGVIDGIAVAKTDRLSRAKTGDALKLVGEIQEIKPGALALLDLGVDPTTPTGEMMLTILLAFAHMQWRQFAEAWQTVQAKAVARGVWIGAAPFGYERGEDGVLVPGPEAEIVTKAYKVAASEGLHVAVSYLQRAVPGKAWRTDDARKLLGSKVYLGESRNGAHVNIAAHEPLTTPDLWQLAQTKPRQRRTNGDYPLSGLVNCGRCGAPLVGQLQTVKGRRYRRMRCSSPACHGGTSISADALETYLREKLKPLLARYEFRVRFDVEGVDLAEARLARAQRQLNEYIADTEIHDLVGADAWRAGVVARQTAVDEAKAQRDALGSQALRSERLPASGELDDPGKLQLALDIIADLFGPVVVRPGRGSLVDRVPLDYLNDRPGVLAA
jgi:DNA invertase Pin-like site-specific DNA recombinase